jgi:ornithine carbamoyltransferase
MKNLLSIEKLSPGEIQHILKSSARVKKERGTAAEAASQPLRGQSWGLIFSKSSTRTRVSFEVGIRELGGDVMFLSANDIQLGRGEPIKDTARVLGRMIHGAVIRTFAQRDVEEFAEFSGIPTINALTDDEHPCQILTDIFTFEEKRGSIQGRVVTFVGDAACNVPVSWIFAAGKLGFELRLAAPRNFQPSPELIRKSGAKVLVTENVLEAAKDADLLYTDVWVSMGKEAESAARIKELTGYQINEQVVAAANPGALVMHCLPAYRGKEITEQTFEKNAATIFDQAENRLHVQKAILEWIVKK